MRAAIAPLLFLFASTLAWGNGVAAEPGFQRRTASERGGLELLGARRPRGHSELPFMGALDGEGRALKAEPVAHVGDGGGADVGNFQAIQTGYGDPNDGHVVTLLWQEQAFNPPGSLALFIDGGLFQTFDGRPEEAQYPGMNLARVTNVPAGDHAFVLEAQDGTAGQANLLVVDAPPFKELECFGCEAGAFVANGSCELLLRWDDVAPLASGYLVLYNNQLQASIPAGPSGAVFGASPGDYCLDLVALTQTPEGTYGNTTQTCCQIACDAAACSAPVDLALCQSAYGDLGQVDVSWRTPEVAQKEAFIGHINNLPLEVSLAVANACGAGGSCSATFTGLPPGEVTLGVQSDCGDLGMSTVSSRTFPVLAETPHPSPVLGDVMYIDDPETAQTRMSWTNDVSSLYVEVSLALADNLDDRFSIGIVPPEDNAITINGTNENDIPVLQFFTVADCHCYGSEPIVAIAPPQGSLFVRGFCDGGPTANVSTVLFFFNYLFLRGPGPSCLEACNLDANGRLDLNDGVFLLNYLFVNGPVPQGWADAAPTCEFAPLEDCREPQDFCPL